MNHQMKLYTIVVLASLALVIARDNYLVEKPAFLSTCKRADPQFNSCFVSNLKAIFREWKDGVPGLKSLGTLDPLQVKRIGLAQNDNNPLAQLNVDLLNAKLYGFSKLDILDFSFDFDTMIAKFKVIAPRFETKANYKIKGRVLNLNLDGSGKTDLKIDNIVLNIIIQLKPRDEYGFTFLDVKKLRLNIGDVSGFHIDNVFDGPKELQESTNALINQNWRDFIPVLTPTIAEAAEAVLSNRLTKVFGYLPANYIVEDFPTAAEFNAK